MVYSITKSYEIQLDENELGMIVDAMRAMKAVTDTEEVGDLLDELEYALNDGEENDDYEN